ncbi:uncharacterized protein V6R79_007205 [Siganus canaliculatus]
MDRSLMAQGQDSREHSKPGAEHQGSWDLTDLNSGEGMRVSTQDTGYLSGKQTIRSSIDQVTGNSHRRKAAPKPGNLSALKYVTQILFLPHCESDASIC